jgi:NDP-sugar pyrophosphorylase family protein
MPLTSFINKGMVEVAGKPFLEHLLDQFREQGIYKILLLTGYQHDSIERYFKDGRDFNLMIEYDFQPEEVNHGKRIECAFEKLDEVFLLHKNDIFWRFDKKSHLAKYIQYDKPVMMTVYDNANKDGIYGARSNIVVENGLVTAYDDLSDDPKYIGQDLGYVIAKRESLANSFLSGNFSLHNDGLLSNLAQKRLLSGYVTKENAVTTTDTKTMDVADQFLKHVRSVKPSQ